MSTNIRLCAIGATLFFSHVIQVAPNQMLEVQDKLLNSEASVWLPMCGKGSILNVTARSHSGQWCEDPYFGTIVAKRCGVVEGFIGSQCYQRLSDENRFLISEKLKTIDSSSPFLFNLLGKSSLDQIADAYDDIDKQLGYRLLLRTHNQMPTGNEIIYFSTYAMVSVCADSPTTLCLTFSGIGSSKEMVAIGFNIFSSENESVLGGFAHRGFKNEYEKIWQDMYPKLKDYSEKTAKRALSAFNFRLSGHSMGGALAVLTALRIAQEIFNVNPDLNGASILSNKIRVYTFGMPRILSLGASKYYNCLLGGVTVRTYLKNDTIVDLTPSIYHHVGQVFYLDKKVNDPHISYSSDLIKGSKEDFDDSIKTQKYDQLQACVGI